MENCYSEQLNELLNNVAEGDLEQAQLVIDNDKYIRSAELGKDLCGEYAEFCNFCDKSLQYPCANAYFNMKQAAHSCAEEPEVCLATENTEEAPVEEVEEPVKKRVRVAVAKRKKK